MKEQVYKKVILKLQLPQNSLEGWLKQPAGPIPRVNDSASLGRGQSQFAFLTSSKALAKAAGWEPHSENTDLNHRQKNSLEQKKIRRLTENR